MNRGDLMAMCDFTGKTFAVTGGAGALGGDVVVTLAGCGANVMILDLRLGAFRHSRNAAGNARARLTHSRST